jgi:hypothetical protein
MMATHVVCLGSASKQRKGLMLGFRNGDFNGSRSPTTYVSRARRDAPLSVTSGAEPCTPFFQLNS